MAKPGRLRSSLEGFFLQMGEGFHVASLLDLPLDCKSSEV
jgi:hypothetical protein